MAATKVSLKLFIDKKCQRRVLLAEADKEFVDFLFSIFTLPIGAVTRLLEEGGDMVGCLPSLYRSIENINDNYIQPDKGKPFLLEPKVVMPGAKVPLLLPNLESTFRQLYSCSCTYTNNTCTSYVTDDNSTICPVCVHPMNRVVTFIDPPRAIRAASSEEGYVKPMVTYMVMDDMEVKPSSSSTLITLLSQFNVYDVRDIEEKVVYLGMDEVCHS